MKIKLEINKNYRSYRYIIGICVVLYILKELLTRYTGDATSVLIFLGADYKTFTLGLFEIFRLITSSFLHDGILHLFCNMYSLYVIGNFIESIYGTKRFLLYLYLGVLFGSLTCGILSTNTIAIGMSGGLYCLLTIMILDLIVFRKFDYSSFIFTVLINISINFMPNVAWQAHLGGAFIGLILFFIEYNIATYNKNAVYLYLTILLCLCLLFGKYFSTKSSIKKYMGTDVKYVYFLENDLNMKHLSKYYNDKIYKYYTEGE